MYYVAEYCEEWEILNKFMSKGPDYEMILKL